MSFSAKLNRYYSVYTQKLFTKFPKLEKYLPRKITSMLLVEIIFLLFLISGIVSAVFLLRSNNDIRQMAAGGCCNDNCMCACWGNGTDKGWYCSTCWDGGGKGYYHSSSDSCQYGSGSSDSSQASAGQDQAANTSTSLNASQQSADVLDVTGSCPSGYVRNHCGDCLWDKCVTENKHCDDLLQAYCGVTPCYVTNTCRTCEPGEFTCAGTTRQVCTLDGVWNTIQTDSPDCDGGTGHGTNETAVGPLDAETKVLVEQVHQLTSSESESASVSENAGVGGDESKNDSVSEVVSDKASDEVSAQAKLVTSSTKRPVGMCVSSSSECSSGKAIYSTTCLESNRSTPLTCSSSSKETNTALLDQDIKTPTTSSCSSKYRCIGSRVLLCNNGVWREGVDCEFERGGGSVCKITDPIDGKEGKTYTCTEGQVEVIETRSEPENKICYLPYNVNGIVTCDKSSSQSVKSGESCPALYFELNECIKEASRHNALTKAASQFQKEERIEDVVNATTCVGGFYRKSDSSDPGKYTCQCLYNAKISYNPESSSNLDPLIVSCDTANKSNNEPQAEDQARQAQEEKTSTDFFGRNIFRPITNLVNTLTGKTSEDHVDQIQETETWLQKILPDSLKKFLFNSKQKAQEEVDIDQLNSLKQKNEEELVILETCGNGVCDEGENHGCRAIESENACKAVSDCIWTTNGCFSKSSSDLESFKCAEGTKQFTLDGVIKCDCSSIGNDIAIFPGEPNRFCCNSNQELTTTNDGPKCVEQQTRTNPLNILINGVSKLLEGKKPQESSESGRDYDKYGYCVESGAEYRQTQTCNSGEFEITEYSSPELGYRCCAVDQAAQSSYNAILERNAEAVCGDGICNEPRENLDTCPNDCTACPSELSHSLGGTGDKKMCVCDSNGRTFLSGENALMICLDSSVGAEQVCAKTKIREGYGYYICADQVGSYADGTCPTSYIPWQDCQAQAAELNQDIMETKNSCGNRTCDAWEKADYCPSDCGVEVEDLSDDADQYRSVTEVQQEIKETEKVFQINDYKVQCPLDASYCYFQNKDQGFKPGQVVSVRFYEQPNDCAVGPVDQWEEGKDFYSFEECKKVEESSKSVVQKIYNQLFPSVEETEKNQWNFEKMTGDEVTCPPDGTQQISLVTPISLGIRSSAKSCANDDGKVTWYCPTGTEIKWRITGRYCGEKGEEEVKEDSVTSSCYIIDRENNKCQRDDSSEVSNVENCHSVNRITYSECVTILESNAKCSDDQTGCIDGCIIRAKVGAKIYEDYQRTKVLKTLGENMDFSYNTRSVEDNITVGYDENVIIFFNTNDVELIGDCSLG